MNQKPLVSIIITTKNEEQNLAHCLKSIETQSYPSFAIETIIVDNNSADKTKEIAYRYTDKVYNFGPERSAQRNFGINKSSGEYILYLDADMILSNDVISECVAKCTGEGCIALYIPERIIGRDFWIKVRNFERTFYDRTVIDCVRFVRLDKFLEIGGFDENLTGPEDWDLDRRIREKGKIEIINAPIYHNEQEFNLKKYINKKLYYATFFDRYIQKWGRDDLIIKKQLGFWYRYFGVFMEESKWRKLVSHPVLTLGLYLLRLNLGINYLLLSKKYE